MNDEALDTFLQAIGFTKIADKSYKFQKAEDESSNKKLLQPGNLKVISKAILALNSKLSELKSGS